MNIIVEYEKTIKDVVKLWMAGERTDAVRLIHENGGMRDYVGRSLSKVLSPIELFNLLNFYSDNYEFTC